MSRDNSDLLRRWAETLEASLPALGRVVALERFALGRSNPTYRVRTTMTDYVLRKKPEGFLLPTAHQVEREARILQRLEVASFPSPRVLFVCEHSQSPIGVPWYAMTFVLGRQTEDPRLDLLTRSDRRPAYESMMKVLASMHALDWRGLQLADLERPGSFVARQIARWSRQVADSTVVPPKALTELLQALTSWTPEAPLVLCHGDFRFGNLILAPTEPCVAAVLDWELAAVGDAHADLAHAVLAHYLPVDAGGVRGLNLEQLGLPAEQDLIDAYVAAGGRPPDQSWNLYLAFVAFRAAAIAHGVHTRALTGQTESAEIGPARLATQRYAEAGLALL